AAEMRGVAKFLQAFAYFREQSLRGSSLRQAPGGRYGHLWTEGLQEMAGAVARGLPAEPAVAFSSSTGAVHVPVLGRVTEMANVARGRVKTIVDAQLEFDI